MNKTATTAVGRKEFSDLMASLGFFETSPAIALACSGGPDSMALAALLRDWVGDRNGTLTALVVDHGIRSESAQEAKTVAAWLAERNISSKVLRASAISASSDLQAMARAARYALMSAWCEKNACLHLAVAHHLDDQAETLLLRLGRGSGVDGLSAMAPVQESRLLRTIRPLLDIPRARLRATLKQHEFPHVTDPSNDNSVFARVRMRGLAPVLAAEGMTPWRLAATASHLARAREALEVDTAQLLADCFVLHAEGYGILKTGKFLAAPRELGLRSLSNILVCVGGNEYPPRFERLSRLYDGLDSIAKGRGRTLAGCRILGRRQGILVCREPGTIAETVPARGMVYWDNRFRMTFAARAKGTVRRLGSDGWAEVVALAPEFRNTKIPAAVRPSLPGIWCDGQLATVPHLGFMRELPGGETLMPRKTGFTPFKSLVSPRFTLH